MTRATDKEFFEELFREAAEGADVFLNTKV